MKLLYGHSEAVADFVVNIIGLPRGFGNCKAIGVIDDDGHLVGGMVYHNWSPETGVIEMSAASTTPRWLTRPVLQAVFAYPFEIDCQMVVIRVSENDKRLYRQLTSYGFKPHEIPRLRGRGESEIIFTLTDDDWKRGKFMRPENGKARRTDTA